MLPVLTPEQMAAADAQTIAAGTSQEELMRRAGWQVARVARELLGGTYGRHVAMFYGKGNNGGDGKVAAEVLSNWGIRVTQLEVESFTVPEAERALARAQLVIDAMFGTGFRGVLRGQASIAMQLINTFTGPVLAVDIPSGVNGATGEVEGQAVQADDTVTFAALKPGHLFEPGKSCTGNLELVDIGIDVSSTDIGVLQADDIASLLPSRHGDTHKWNAGSVLVIGGSSGMTGAPQLASTAAMRAGAGMVWCALPSSQPAQLGGAEFVMRPLQATPEGSIAESAADEILHYASRFGALAIGPGLGSDIRTIKAIQRVVTQSPIPVILDADGLNAFAGDAAALADRAAEVPLILTPHGGEFLRLTGQPVGADRLAAAHRLAETAQAIVVLKGPGTVITGPDGVSFINATGNAALATAGTGDVLTGITAAFVARAIPVLEAAAVATWVHGTCADRQPAAGLVASDLLDVLPSILGELESFEENV